MFTSGMKSTVFVVGETEDGVRWVYELSGAHIQIDEPEPQGIWESRYVLPMPPTMTLTGVLVEGRMWKPGETFTPTQKSLETPLGEIEQ